MSTDPAKTVGDGVASCANSLAKAVIINITVNNVDLMFNVVFMFKKLIVTNRFEIMFVVFVCFI